MGGIDMNVSVIDTIKLLIDYLNTKAAGTELEDQIFTGPNEERDNTTKYFITILYEFVPLANELGDSLARYEITCTLVMGYRVNALSVSGTEKEIGDTFFETYTRYLRSLEFKRYMAVNGVKVPPAHITRGWHDQFSKEFEGIMKFNLTMKLWTYINSLEDIP